MEPNAEITGDRAYDNTANHFLPYLRPEDQVRLRRDLKRHADLYRNHGRRQGDLHNLMHTLSELILGGFLAKRGHSVEHARKFVIRVDGRDEEKTPDWTICGPNSEVRCIVELVNFHGDVQFEEALRGRSTIPVPYPTPEDDLRKLYDALEDKCLTYRGLARHLEVPYVIAVELEFRVSGDITPGEVCDLMLDTNPDSGLFLRFPEVSGLIHFADSNGYHMWYEPNPKPRWPIVMPQGRPME